VADPGEASSPLFSDETEARRAEKKFFGERFAPSPYIRVWMTGPHPISQGLDLALTSAFYVCEKVQKTFWFCDLSIYLRQRSKQGMVKRCEKIIASLSQENSSRDLRTELCTSV